MRLYGFGRYFHQNRDIGDDLPFGKPAQGLALPSGYHLCAMTNCSMPINIFFTTDAVKKLAKILVRVQLSVALACSRSPRATIIRLDINGLDNIRRRGEYSLCSAAALRSRLTTRRREGRPRSSGYQADFETLIQEFPASAARGAVAPHIACGSLEDFSPVSSSGSEDASPRLRAFALRASGSPAIRSRPATSRSRSRRGCAGPSG